MSQGGVVPALHESEAEGSVHLGLRDLRNAHTAQVARVDKVLAQRTGGPVLLRDSQVVLETGPAVDMAAAGDFGGGGGRQADGAVLQLAALEVDLDHVGPGDGDIRIHQLTTKTTLVIDR